MSDTQPSQRAIAKPDEKPTVEMAPPPAWAIEFRQQMTDGFRVIYSDLDGIKTRQDLHATQVKDLGGEIARVGERVRVLEEARTTNSVRVKSMTEEDAKQDTAIAQLVTDVAALKETQATQLAILVRLDKVAANPMVRRVAYTIATALLGYLAAKGYLR